jgi:hypothetical protein
LHDKRNTLEQRVRTTFIVGTPALLLMMMMMATCCRFLLLMYSLYLAKRQELVQALLLVNRDTLQLLQEPDKQHHAWVAQQLGLSSEQQQQIAAGFRVFK